MFDTEKCGCGHLVNEHAPQGPCQQWWRYPDVLDPRPCGCRGIWTKRPASEAGR